MLTASDIVLHQPSITNGSRINLSPPSGNNSKKLHIGRPPATSGDMALSAVISPVSDTPGRDVRLAESSMGSPASSVPSPNDTNKVGDSPLLRTQPSSEASSAVTVTNLQLRPEPAGTIGGGSVFSRSSRLSLMRPEEANNVNNASPRVYGSQYKRHSRRQLSFVPGDDSEFRMKGLTTPTEQSIQSSPGILSKSVAYSAEQSLLAVSPIYSSAKTQEYPERRNHPNHLVTPDGKTEIVGPSAHINGPGVSAVESLKRVQAAVCTTSQEETGSVRALNGIAAAVFARRVLQSIPTENSNDSQKATGIEPARALFENVYDKGKNRAEYKDISL